MLTLPTTALPIGPPTLGVTAAALSLATTALWIARRLRGCAGSRRLNRCACLAARFAATSTTPAALALLLRLTFTGRLRR